MWEIGTLMHFWRVKKWCSLFGKQSDRSSKYEVGSYHASQQFRSYHIPKRSENIYTLKALYMNVRSHIIRDSLKVETNQMSSSC